MGFSQTDKKSFDLNFLPNEMVCYSGLNNNVFAFCPKTNMLAFASDKKFSVLGESQIQFSNAYYYKKGN